MNRVRKHLSAIKGGRLAAAAHPAKVVSLLISDVPGDDPAAIASGPTVPDPTTFADARAILARYGIEPPPAVRRHLERGRGGDAEARRSAPGRGRDRHDRDAAAVAGGRGRGRAQAAGVTPLLLGDALEGEAREVGRVMAGIARSVGRARPAAAAALRPALRRRDHGHRARQGPRRAQRRVPAGAWRSRWTALPGVWAIAGDTDGIDGAEAGGRRDRHARHAWRAPRASGSSRARALADNDGHGFFEALGDQVVTGPTLTNVNDFRAILILPTAA